MTNKLMSLETTKRNAILNAALKEFAAKGFEKASTNIIAKEAEISKSLLFHYINSKKELFQCVYDYFFELLEKEYYSKMDLAQKDILGRLRQSYLLQIKLVKKHPGIFEFNRLALPNDVDDINKQLANQDNKKQSSRPCQLFDNIDETKFRKDLDIKKCKQFILWANSGITNQILMDISNTANEDDGDIILQKLDTYLDELKKVFYSSND